MTGPKAFISYAAEDFRSAERLYDDLLARGFDPWLDRKNLRPGQDWRVFIDRALREADFVLVLVSENAATKRGYVQREIKQALDAWQEKLQEDVFLIPCRIEECNVPEALRRFQWVDLFSGDGFERLVDTLSSEAHRLVRARVALGLNTSATDVRVSEASFSDKGTAGSRYVVTATYPELTFHSQPSDLLNSVVRGMVFREISTFLNNCGTISPPTFEGPDEEYPPSWTSSFDLHYSGRLIAQDIVSFEFSIVTYYARAAHPDLHTRTLNFFQPGPALVNFSSLIDHGPDAIKFVSRYCISTLQRDLDYAPESQAPDEWIASGAGPDSSNFEKFVITNHGLSIRFDAYQVDCYASGPQTVEIPAGKMIRHVADRFRPGLKAAWRL